MALSEFFLCQHQKYNKGSLPLLAYMDKWQMFDIVFQLLILILLSLYCFVFIFLSRSVRQLI